MRANGNSTHEILGKIVTAIASIAMTAAFAVPAMAASDSGTAADSGTTQQSGQYKIYPQPQNTEYGDGSLILRDKANTVVEPGIDSATKARLNEALKLKGIETTAASKILEGWVPPYDATVIEKLKAAGMPLLGKTNLDEFAQGSSTEHSAYQTTHNPWDTERVPGGSGGGSASAVAAFEAPIALGTDTGGSVSYTHLTLPTNSRV